MAVHYRTQGFIFKRADRAEADRVFSVFTQDLGRLEIFAKAIRKVNSKLKSGIDAFYLSEIEFIQGKNRKTLTDAILIKRFSSISGNPKKLEISAKIAEDLSVFIKGQEKDEKIFNLLKDTFIKLNDYTLTPKTYTPIYIYFMWNFFSELGYAPETQKCAGCKDKLNPYGLYFSNKEGGIICKKCFNIDRQALKINSDSVKMLRIILKNDWQTFSRLKIEESSQKLLERISENYRLHMVSSHSFS